MVAAQMGSALAEHVDMLKLGGLGARGPFN